MLIKIDTRERELIKKCEDLLVAVPAFKELKIEVHQLPLGDIIICCNKYDNPIDNILVERKTLSDLAASIKDGRYEEQSYRLNGLPLHNHNIVYLIEGDLGKFNSFKERIDKQTIYSAMFSINYFKGFSLMRTNTIDETAFMICNMAYKMGKETGKKPYFQNKIEEPNNGEQKDLINGEQKDLINREQKDLINGEQKDLINREQKDLINGEQNQIVEQKDLINGELVPSLGTKDYCSVIKKVKKDNITHENIGEIMLCQIPGVSSVSAIAILGKFKTLPELIKALQQDPTCLTGVTTCDANGKSRKISKTTIETIVKYLS
jgi:ERCC4-type nuclease